MSAAGGVPWTMAGVTPPRLARVALAKVTSETPFEWVVGYVFTATPWHSWQSTGVITCVAGVGTACDWCAPTRTPVDADCVSSGGMAMRLFAFTCAGPKVPAVCTRPAVPWQLEHVRFGTFDVPSRWTALFTVQPARLPDVQL